MNQEKLYYLFEKSVAAIIIFNTQDGIQYVNQASLRLFAYERDHLKNQPFSLLLPSSLQTDFDSFIESKKKSFYQSQIDLQGAEKQLVSADIRIQRMSKETTMPAVYLATIYPIHSNHTTKARAITDEEPSLEIRNLLSLLKKETDIPLSTLNTLVDSLLDLTPRPDQMPLLENIQHSSHQLQEIIGDVVLYADLLQGRINPDLQPFNLHYVLRELQDGYEARADFKLLTDENIPTTLVGDASLIRQILEKLLDHLFAFTSGKRIRLQVLLESKIVSTVIIRFSLIDHGITPKHLLWLKQVFFSPSLSLSQEWGSLGLSISNHLIKKLGGVISLENETLSRVTIHFSLPLRVVNDTLDEREANLPVDLVQQESPLQGLNVLYVEDVIPNHFLMEGLCSIWQVSLDTALNGQEALDKLRHNTYDVILMDLQMPIMNGYETAQHIRHASFLKDLHIPIVAVSGSASEDTLIQIKKYGMNDFLPKPIKPDELYQKLLRYTSS